MWNKKIILSLSAVAVVGIAVLGLGGMGGGLQSSAVGPLLTLTERQAAVVTAVAEVARLQASLTTLATEVANNAATLSQSRGALAQLEQEEIPLNAALVKATSDYTKSRLAADEYNRDTVETTRARLPAANVEKTRLEASLRSLPVEISALKADISRLKAELKKIPTKETARRAAAQRVITEKEALQIAKERELAGTPALLKSAKSLIASLPASIAAVEGKLSILRGYEAQYKTIKENAQIAVTAKKGSISQMRATIDTAQNTSDALATQKSGLETALIAAETTLIAARAAVVAAQTAAAAAQAAEAAARETSPTSAAPSTTPTPPVETKSTGGTDTDKNKGPGDDSPKIDENGCPTCEDEQKAYKTALEDYNDVHQKNEGERQSIRIELHECTEGNLEATNSILSTGSYNGGIFGSDYRECSNQYQSAMNALERKKEQQKNALSDARRALENCEKRKTECQINSEPASTSPYNCDDLKKQLEDIQSDIGSYQRLIKQYTEEGAQQLKNASDIAKLCSSISNTSPNCLKDHNYQEWIGRYHASLEKITNYQYALTILGYEESRLKAMIEKYCPGLS